MNNIIWFVAGSLAMMLLCFHGYFVVTF